jgi:L-fucose isomerase-like protein
MSDHGYWTSPVFHFTNPPVACSAASAAAARSFCFSLPNANAPAVVIVYPSTPCAEMGLRNTNTDTIVVNTFCKDK